MKSSCILGPTDIEPYCQLSEKLIMHVYFFVNMLSR
jgi:hypothetical protein